MERTTDKHIFITNGMGGCGKDTFAELLNEIIPTVKFSSIDVIKVIARSCGWNGGKTDKDRKFLSDLKQLTNAYSDLAFKSVMEQVELFKINPVDKVMLIDIREPDEIKRAVEVLEAKAILIENNRIPVIDTNPADANVFNYDYDIIIPNNGSLDEFRSNVELFAKTYLNSY